MEILPPNRKGDTSLYFPNDFHTHVTEAKLRASGPQGWTTPPGGLESPGKLNMG